MWVVIQEQTRRGVQSYFVRHTKTGECRGEFDCERWAQLWADELNRKEQDGR